METGRDLDPEIGDGLDPGKSGVLVPEREGGPNHVVDVHGLAQGTGHVLGIDGGHVLVQETSKKGTEMSSGEVEATHVIASDQEVGQGRGVVAHLLEDADELILEVLHHPSDISLLLTVLLTASIFYFHILLSL